MRPVQRAWACAGQRHFVPKTYPGPPNPLSPPSSGPRRGEPAVLAAAYWRSGEKGPTPTPTHCAADRLVMARRFNDAMMQMMHTKRAYLEN
jgi:hypothetical protein